MSTIVAEAGNGERRVAGRSDRSPPSADRPGTTGPEGITVPTPSCTLSCFFFVWFTGIAGAMAMVGVVGGSARNGEIPALPLFLAVLPAQQFSTLGALYLCSRWKGSGSLRTDFGFEVRWGHASMLFGGVALQFGMDLVLAPLVHWLGNGEVPQDIVRDVDAVRGLGSSLAMAVSVAVLAPVIEELLYRGLLLRALLRRLPTNAAVLMTGTVFGAVHLFDTGLRLEALPVVFALVGFGVLLAVLAVRDGSLSRPIFLHMGFNSAVVLLALVT